MAPDFAFILKARLTDLITKGYVPVVPDIVLETRCPSDTRREVADKVERWQAAGVRLVWELDPATQVLTVYRTDHSPLALGISDTPDGGDIFPGFALPITNIFPPRPK